MPSKSKSLDLILTPPAWVTSLAFHAALALGVFLALWSPETPQLKSVDMEIYEAPKVSPKAAASTPLPKEVAPQDTRRPVFGVTRTAVRSSEGVDVKAGNTVAKTPDNEILREDDANSLPIPVDEFLVSKMPRLKSEIRIPYPAEAKAAGVQGPVVMDLLIDQTGRVREVNLVSGPGHGLNEAAVLAVRGFEFSPAEVEGKSVAVRIRYSYRFVLERP